MAAKAARKMSGDLTAQKENCQNNYEAPENAPGLRAQH